MKNPIFQGNFHSYRVKWGGSWFHSTQHLRVSDRRLNEPTLTLSFLGFRVFRTKVES